MARVRSWCRGFTLAALVLFLAVPARGCACWPVAPPTAEPPAHLTDTQPPAPAPDPPAPPPATPCRYPAYRYHVEGPDVHLVAAEFFSTTHISAAEYWLVGDDPVTIEVRFAAPLPDPTMATRQILERLPGAVVHDVGHEPELVFVKASLPPGQYFVNLVGTGRAVDWGDDHRLLILHKGRPFRLMRREPGRSPEVLGEYLLPSAPFVAALEGERDQAFFGTIAIDDGCAGVDICLWRWQPGSEPSLTRLSGLWPWGRVFPRDDDLLLQAGPSLRVLGRCGKLIATLVEYDCLVGTAVGPGDEVAIFLGRNKGERELDLDLTVFTAALETYRTWDAICPHGVLDAIPDVEPTWHGDEIFFLALEDRHQVPPTYQLMAVDVRAGSVRRVRGPIVRGHRVGRSHYALLEHYEGAWALWDPATSSLRALPSAREVGERWSPWPVAVGADWVVFRAESGLLAWHPSMGMKPLGHGMAVVGMGEAFLWWTAVPEDR